MDTTVHVNLVDDEDEKDPLALDSSIENSDIQEIKKEQSIPKHQPLTGGGGTAAVATKPPHTLRRHVPRIVVKPIPVDKKGGHINESGTVAGGGNIVSVQGNATTNTSPTGRGSSSRRLQQQAKAAAAAASAASASLTPSACAGLVSHALTNPLNSPATTTAVTQASTMREVLASIPGFSVKPRRRSSKKISTAAQIEQTKDGKIDLETPDSILASTNLRALLNKQTFSLLPPFYQYNLIQLLPSVDREAIEIEPPNSTNESPIQSIRLGASSLNNEFFARACLEWRERLSEGEFTPENQMKLKTEAEKEKNKLDPWKLKHFEPIWGEKYANRASSTSSNDSNSSLSSKLRQEVTWPSSSAGGAAVSSAPTTNCFVNPSSNTITTTYSTPSSSTTSSSVASSSSSLAIKIENDSKTSHVSSGCTKASSSNSSCAASSAAPTQISKSSNANKKADEKLEFKLETKGGGLTATIVKTSKASPASATMSSSSSSLASKDEVDSIKSEKLVKHQQAENICDKETDLKPDVLESTKCPKTTRASLDNALRIQNQSKVENMTTSSNNQTNQSLTTNQQLSTGMNDLNRRASKRPSASPSRRKRGDLHNNNENISKQMKMENLRPCEENVPNNPITISITTSSVPASSTISSSSSLSIASSGSLTINSSNSNINSIKNINTSMPSSSMSTSSNLTSISTSTFASSSSSSSSLSLAATKSHLQKFSTTLSPANSSPSSASVSALASSSSLEAVANTSTLIPLISNNSTCDNYSPSSRYITTSSIITSATSSTSITPSTTLAAKNISSVEAQQESSITSVVITSDDDEDLDEDENMTEDDLHNISDDVIITTPDDDADDPDILAQKFADAENYVLESGEVISSDSSDCIIISP